MNSNKFLIGGIAGGIANFILGYLFYGLLLKKFFAENGMMVNMDTIVWWALIVGNLVTGLLFSYIIRKANVSSTGGGAGIGFTVGILMALSLDLMMYSFGQGMKEFKGIAADILTTAVISAIVGAVIGYFYGMGKKAAA